MMKFYLTILSVFIFLATVSPSYAISVVDDKNNTITLDVPAKRIITLAPSLTEMIYKIGAQDSLVATVKSSNYPEAAKKIDRVGDYERFNMERLLSYKPDLILAWSVGNSSQQVEKVKKFNIPVYLTEPVKIEDIAHTLRNIGILTGREKKANAVAKEFEKRLSNIKEKNKHRTKIKAFYQIWYDPIYTVNGKTVISRIMAICGLDNIFSDARISAPKITQESVIQKNPEIIIASGIYDGENIVPPDWIAKWKRWPALTAVAKSNLFFIDPDIINRHSTRILDGADEMCELAEQARKNVKKN